MSRHRHAARVPSLFAHGALIAVVALSGCSGGDTGSPTTDPAKNGAARLAQAIASCGDNVSADEAERSAECEAAEFTEYLADAGLEGLAESDAVTALAYVRGLCLYAVATAEEPPESRATLDEVVASTAASWEADESVVREAFQAMEALCPDGSAAIQAIDDGAPLDTTSADSTALENTSTDEVPPGGTQ